MKVSTKASPVQKFKPITITFEPHEWFVLERMIGQIPSDVYGPANVLRKLYNILPHTDYSCTNIWKSPPPALLATWPKLPDGMYAPQ